MKKLKEGICFIMFIFPVLKFNYGINIIIVFYLVLGTLSLAAYMKIGYEHQNNYGEKYIPTFKKAEQ